MNTLVFCGGGSAGHIIPNIALIEECRTKYHIIYLGSKNSIEEMLCNKHNITFYPFPTVKYVRGKILINLKIPFALIKSIHTVKRILKKVNADLVFCKGGYVSLPPAIAGHILKIPVITHESDFSLGVANKIISRFAKLTLTSFPETARGVKNAKYVGSPIRELISNTNKGDLQFTLSLPKRPTILVFGGGSGSQFINKLVHATASTLCQSNNLIHICGKGNKILSNLLGYVQFEYYDNIGELFSICDAIVCRAGANSIFEILSVKKPALLIPLCNKQSRGDQLENANYFENLGLCHVLQEKNCTPKKFLLEIQKLFSDENLIKNLKSYQTPNANEHILTIIDRITHKPSANAKRHKKN